MTLIRALHCLNPENTSFESVHTMYIIYSLLVCLCINICFSFQMWLVFSIMNRIKNRPLTIVEPQAHKKLNPALTVSNIWKKQVSAKKCSRKKFVNMTRVRVGSVLSTSILTAFTPFLLLLATRLAVFCFAITKIRKLPQFVD